MRTCCCDSAEESWEGRGEGGGEQGGLDVDERGRMKWAGQNQQVVCGLRARRQAGEL